jgi:hypothetical protein
MSNGMELDGDYWKMGERKKENRYTEKIQKRRLSEVNSNTRGRKPVCFGDLQPKYQNEKLIKFNATIRDSVHQILNLEKDQELKDAWLNANPWFSQQSPIKVNCSSSIIEDNVIKFYSSIPETSEIKTVVLNELFAGIDNRKVSNMLSLSDRRIRNARTINSQPLAYYLRCLEIPRDRLGMKETCLMNWFALVCIVPSGKNRRCFFGLPVAMFVEYFSWCKNCSFPHVSPEVFFLLRKRENIMILKGDIFIDKGIVRVAEIDRQLLLLPLDSGERVKLIEEKNSLIEEDLFAKGQIKKYCQDHRELEFNLENICLSLDFTASQTSMSDKFTDFVVVMASGKPITIPDTLLSLVIDEEKPPSLKDFEIELPNIEKKKRRTKKELEGVEKKDVLPNLRSDIKVRKKQKKLSVIDPPPTHFKPCLVYLHFVIKRDVDVKQTLDYVQWVLELLVQVGFFDLYKNLLIWSDGCGKHFKTYDTHFLMGFLQEKLQKTIIWKFLAPNRAHNYCDAAAAHLKLAFKKYIQSFYMLSICSHLAFAAGKLMNTYLIEADYSSFRQPQHCIPDETFMRNAFSFTYSSPYKELVYCKHKCVNKKTCNHKCCYGIETTTVKLIVGMRDGSTIVRYLRSSNVHGPNTSDIDAVDSFWGTYNDRVIHSLPELRVTSEGHQDAFDYGSVTYDDNSDDEDYGD